METKKEILNDDRVAQLRMLVVSTSRAITAAQIMFFDSIRMHNYARANGLTLKKKVPKHLIKFIGRI